MQGSEEEATQIQILMFTNLKKKIADQGQVLTLTHDTALALSIQSLMTLHVRITKLILTLLMIVPK